MTTVLLYTHQILEPQPHQMYPFPLSTYLINMITVQYQLSTRDSRSLYSLCLATKKKQRSRTTLSFVFSRSPSVLACQGLPLPVYNIYALASSRAVYELSAQLTRSFGTILDGHYLIVVATYPYPTVSSPSSPLL